MNGYRALTAWAELYRHGHRLAWTPGGWICSIVPPGGANGRSGAQPEPGESCRITDRGAALIRTYGQALQIILGPGALPDIYGRYVAHLISLEAEYMPMLQDLRARGVLLAGVPLWGGWLACTRQTRTKYSSKAVLA